jgi:hypothetical protein
MRRRQAELRVVLRRGDARAGNATEKAALVIPVELSRCKDGWGPRSPRSALTATFNLTTPKVLWQAIHAVGLLVVGCA